MASCADNMPCGIGLPSMLPAHHVPLWRVCFAGRLAYGRESDSAMLTAWLLIAKSLLCLQYICMVCGKGEPGLLATFFVVEGFNCLLV